MPFPVTNPSLARALAQRGYAEPTSVQSAVLAPETEGRDLLVSAQTGSGKTVAFGLALAGTVLGESETMPATKAPLVLVIAPTRELALQVHAELTWLYEFTGARILSCVGGMDARREAKLLHGGCHFVVGTPGRLKDHIERGNLRLDELEAVVLDEADEMLDLGFREELEFILSAAPESRRTLLFSATIAREIAALARTYQQNALRIDTVAHNQPHADIEYRAVRVAGHELEAALVNILRAQDSRALVFCATRDNVRTLHANLMARGFTAAALSGELSQAERNAALSALRDGRAQVCIATDVAARGLDLPDLDLVVHADLPTNKATFLHRSGRTGRAGRKGVSVLLVPHMRRRRAEMLLREANAEAIWVDPPTPADIRAKDEERLLSHPSLSETPGETALTLAAKLLERTAPEVIAAAFVKLAEAHLPVPAHVTILPPEPASRPARAPRAGVDTGHGPSPRAVVSNGSWFRVALGRKQNADPRWLIPLICKAGGITKQEIGTIRIFDRETKFEIASHAAQAFSTAAAAQGEAQIQPAAPPGNAPPRPHFDGPPTARPAFKKKQADKPYGKPRAPKTDGKPNEQQRRRRNKDGRP
ncbi:MAG: DEAD/DEAH box helicase [Rhodospirillales bacterium]|nr:DEAD/DEAH box helicase [Rhodospirillales bacterium]MDE2318264.1 DEAD/DEAH box helicase [Rhodospirillales bacterium]